jgi:hypothetical protein
LLPPLIHRRDTPLYQDDVSASLDGHGLAWTFYADRVYLKFCLTPWCATLVCTGTME